MSFHVIIPSRFASTRFPGKPLATIAGKAMVLHVIDRARASGAASVTVATDDQRIFDQVVAYGASAVMTRADHESGTDRLHEAAQLLGLGPQDIVVNVQGDEPLIDPVLIKTVADNLAANQQCTVSTLCERIIEMKDYINGNVVKVVWNAVNEALYFSRAAIPWGREVFSQAEIDWGKMSPDLPAYRHLGIYGYRVVALNAFVTWPMSPLEQIEKLEQLRFMGNGHKIHIAISGSTIPSIGVDTPEDLERVAPLMERYL
jgi:3-deoxy-manno-octulosonate cytidylyltransferase (CMP-KDO synthetase)